MARRSRRNRRMAGNEEEAMELSGESGLVSNLHQFSFDVSWSHHERDPSPLQVQRRPLLSPSRFQVSTPISRDWKSLTQPRRAPLHSPFEVIRNSTVKVSQTTPALRENPTPERRQSYSPMELDASEQSFDLGRSRTKLRKRHSDFCVSYKGKGDQKIVAPLKNITEYDGYGICDSSLKEGKNQRADSLSLNENNNNYKGESFDHDDSVFLRDETSNTGRDFQLKRKKGKRLPVSKHKAEKKSSHILLVIMILTMISIVGYFLFHASSCSVFDIDMVKLKHKLEDNVFGQQVAVKAVVKELEKFGQAVKEGTSKRTLVMSFHGWTGVGKNFISRFIAEAFYNNKVTLFSIPWHFPHEAQSEEEARKLQRKVKTWIIGNVTKCGVNVFIFDEMDKAKRDFLSGLQSAMEEIRREAESLANSSIKSPIIVILFISNSKAVQINQYLFSQIGLNRDREQMQIDEFLFIFQKDSEEWYSYLKKSNLVDLFVPFLPLAESHVRKCIVKDFIHKGRDPSEQLIEAVMEELSFFDMGGNHGQMSLTGCKRVHDKVDLHMDD